MKKIMFVVGHSHWGKSKTLLFLTNGNHRKKRITIQNNEFFIKRMSNDDFAKGYIKFMRSLDPALRPFLIATLCPVLDKNDMAEAAPILKNLRIKGYQLYFWVIEHQYATSNVVTPKEIQLLRKYGKVEVFSALQEASIRAKNFNKFILKHI